MKNSTEKPTSRLQDYVFKLALLSIVWVVLMESAAPLHVLIGLVISMLTLLFVKRTLPFEPVTNIKWLRFAFIHGVLITEIYKAGFAMIKRVFLGGEVHMVPYTIELDSRFLSTIFCAWMTLTPGTIVTEIDGSRLTVLGMTAPGDHLLEAMEPGATDMVKLLRSCIINPDSATA